MAQITGDDDNNVLDGVLDETNTIRGNGGSDTIRGGNLADMLVGGAGDDWIDGGSGNDSIHPGPGSDAVVGEAGDDFINLSGAEVGDIVTADGGDGQDVFWAGVGSDDINGGVGFDVVNFGNLTEGVAVNLQFGFAGDGAAGDNLTGIEGLRGTLFDDELAGTEGPDFIEGWEGDDLIAGLGGPDYLVGGTGFDIVVFGWLEGSLRIDLATGIGRGGDAEGVAFYEFEGIWAGASNDRLSGDKGRNVLGGGDGNDHLIGRDGRDELIGGAGSDRLRGGADGDTLSGEAGGDRFAFYAVSDSGVRAKLRDVITDFSRRDGDLILLSQIDADSNKRGDQAFEFIGRDQFTKDAAQLQFAKDQDRVRVVGDVDADGRGDFTIDLENVDHLKASDFIL